MVAPNGARLTHQDHPGIPISVDEVVRAVCDATDRGAQAVHLHVRDEQQKHVLDIQRYQKSISAIQQALGRSFPIQVTTEAVGRYSQLQQIELVRGLRPEFVSVALAEVAGEEEQLATARDFYHWCESDGIAVQHILYSREDFQRFMQLKTSDVIPSEQSSVLFVLGRYTENQQSSPDMLDPFMSELADHPGHNLHWMICAFGQGETDCLVHAAELGGHCRVGFENNRLNKDASVASDNAQRVGELVSALPSDYASTGNPGIRQVLGQR